MYLYVLVYSFCSAVGHFAAWRWLAAQCPMAAIYIPAGYMIQLDKAGTKTAIVGTYDAGFCVDPGPNVLLRNSGGWVYSAPTSDGDETALSGTFTALEAFSKMPKGYQYDNQCGTRWTGTVGVAWGDLDNDGWLDLVYANKEGTNEVWRNLGGWSWQSASGLAPSCSNANDKCGFLSVRCMLHICSARSLRMHVRPDDFYVHA